MEKAKIQHLIAEVDSVIDAASHEDLPADSPAGAGYKLVIEMAKLAAVRDILEAIRKDL